MRTLRPPFRHALGPADTRAGAHGIAVHGIAARGVASAQAIVASMAAVLSSILALSGPADAAPGTAAAASTALAGTAAESVAAPPPAFAGSVPGAPAPLADARWLPWLGCWAPDGAAAGGGSAERVCVLPAPDGVGIEIVTVGAEGEAGTVRIVADGSEQAVEESGCAGWERARWSDDGRRVLRRSELECGNGLRRVSSGVLALLPGEVWLDVQTAELNGQHYATRALRYRPADPPAALERRVANALADRRAAQSVSRMNAALPPSPEAVIELVDAAGAEAARTLILERGAGFELDGATLVALADAGVPGDVTDLMIALTYPDRFDVSRTGHAVAAADAPPDGLDDTALASPFAGFDPFYDPGRGFYADCLASPLDRSWYGLRGFGYGYGYGCSPYGYGLGGYYGPGYGWSYGGTRIVVVPVNPSDGGDGPAARPARVVNGRGYTRGDAGGSGARAVPRQRPPDRSVAPGGSRPTVTRDGGFRSGGSTGARGARPSSGGSDGVRTAKPRGSGQED